MPRWLSDYDGRRDNNFTLIRLIFAWAVLFGHAWAITGVGGHDPLSRLFRGYVWIGEIAVDGFFAISGFLVAGSFLRHGAAGYSVARILRIWPALIVCILLSAFVLGWWETTLSTGDYFADPVMHRYLFNIPLWPKVQWYLPGVFKDHANAAVNGSLWTLPAETGCYFVLLIIGLFGLLDTRRRATATMILLLWVGYTSFTALPVFGVHSSWARPMSYFVLGVLVWFNRRTLPLHWSLAITAAIVPALLIYADVGEVIFYPVFAACLVYLIFFAAYRLPHVKADRYPGDISYGIYIYAWPCQQLVYWQGQVPWTNAALATFLTVTLAALSWYCVEKPALGLKRRVDRVLKGETSPKDLPPPSQYRY